MDHSSGLVFRRPPAALRRRAVVYFYAAVLIPTPAPVDAERKLLARDLDAQIRERFEDDHVALLVYESFLQKMKPVDIQSCLGISEKEYNAAAKRLRRAVRSISEGGPR